LEFAILDIETSGGTPKESKIIEIAIIIHDGEKVIDTYESLVNPEKSIDWYVQKLTGIKDKDVENAPKFYEIAKDVFKFLENRVFVAHNIGFDYPIVRNEYKQLGFDLRLPHLCTIKSSRVLIPDLESYGLKNLSKHLEIDLDNHHRAMDDTKATALIFEHIYNLDDNNLENFIRQDVNPKQLHPKLNLDKFDDIPNKTGIYKLYNSKKELIYIGKSIHIKKRIEQHLKNVQTDKAIEMQSKIADIKYELTGSELIALLLESSLIKEKQPIYNRAQKTINFNYGLYSYEDQNGYKNLLVKKNTGTEQPLHTFKTLKEGKEKLDKWKNEFNLCLKLCNLNISNSECFDYSIKKCEGACKGIENNVLYNIKVDALLNKLNFNFKDLIILDKGKNKNEYSFVFIQNGDFVGYGNVMKFLFHKDKQSFRKHLKKQNSNRDSKAIINSFLNKNTNIEVIEL
jgi:DNA polymerase-3 subunit epsilon